MATLAINSKETQVAPSDHRGDRSMVGSFFLALFDLTQQRTVPTFVPSLDKAHRSTRIVKENTEADAFTTGLI